MSEECRSRKGERLARFAHVRISVEAEEHYWQTLEKLWRTWFRLGLKDLSPVELVAEMERWELELAILRQYPDSPARRWGEEWAQGRLEDATRRLRDIDRAQVSLRAWDGATAPNFDHVRYVDLVGLVETLTGIPGRRAGGTTVFSCPFHDEDSASFTVYPPGKGWYCFGCGKGGGDAVSFVAALKGLTQVEALAIVEEVATGVTD
jgi:hypothetical protein